MTTTTSGDHRPFRRQPRSARAVLLILTALFSLIGCTEKPRPADSQIHRQSVKGVSVAAIAPAAIDRYDEATGTVKADRTSSVASRMMGTVTSLLIKEGDPVQSGQLLLTIDDRDVQQKVKAAEAGHREAVKALESAKQNRELAGITYDRYKKMYDEKAISRQEMDQFETQKKVAELEHERIQEMVKKAEAGVAEAKVYLDFTRITSPVRGRVTEKKTEMGSMAVPGMPLLTIEHTDGYIVETSLDEGLSGKVRIGTPVSVSIAAIGKELPGKIKEVLPVIDPLSRSFIAKVAVAGLELKSGLYANVKIFRGKQEVLLAPQEAIVEKGQLTGVYTVDNQGIVTYRLVKLGRDYQGSREILSGLKPNDRIIVKGAEKAVDGGVLAEAK